MIEMREVIAELSQGLDTQVAEGGSNFSCGQRFIKNLFNLVETIILIILRQLLCFGRAILNNCRIVIMDEATGLFLLFVILKLNNLFQLLLMLKRMLKFKTQSETNSKIKLF
jgi:hypothetical protein